MKYTAIKCAVVGSVRICRSFTKHGMNNMKVTKSLTKFTTNLWVTSNMASVVQWRHLAWKSPSVTDVLCFCLTVLTEDVTVTSQFLSSLYKMHSQPDTVSLSLSLSLSHGTTVLCCLWSIKLHPYFMHSCVLKLVELFNRPASLTLNLLVKPYMV